MANTIQNIKESGGVLVKAAAQMLEDELQFVKSIAKVPAEEYSGKNGYKSGDTVYINKPYRPTVGNSFDITSGIQDVTEEKVALTVSTPHTVGIALDSLEIATEIDLANKLRLIAPAISAIAQNIESDFLTTAYRQTYNSVGTPGSTIFDTRQMGLARAKMQQFLCPKDMNRFALLDSLAEASAVDARKGLFQKSDEIAEQYKMGYMGMADGFTYLSNELLPTHTNGVDVTGIAVENTVVTIATGMTTLGVDGVTSGATITAGTVFTIAGVNAVHPITKDDTGQLQQFVVTASVTETSGNSVIMAISPAIYSSASGSLQNVTALPADEAAVTFIGAASTGYKQNLCFHKEAFRMVSLPLEMPTRAEFAEQATSDGGLTIAIVRDFDILKRRFVTRLDFLGAIAPVRPEWACRVWA